MGSLSDRRNLSLSCLLLLNMFDHEKTCGQTVSRSSVLKSRVVKFVKSTGLVSPLNLPIIYVVNVPFFFVQINSLNRRSCFRRSSNNRSSSTDLHASCSAAKTKTSRPFKQQLEKVRASVSRIRRNPHFIYILAMSTRESGIRTVERHSERSMDPSSIKV